MVCWLDGGVVYIALRCSVVMMYRSDDMAVGHNID